MQMQKGETVSKPIVLGWFPTWVVSNRPRLISRCPRLPNHSTPSWLEGLGSNVHFVPRPSEAPSPTDKEESSCPLAMGTVVQHINVQNTKRAISSPLTLNKGASCSFSKLASGSAIPVQSAKSTTFARMRKMLPSKTQKGKHICLTRQTAQDCL